MKRASHLQRPMGHRTRPSNTSITSFGLDLEQALDNIDLVRHDSRVSDDTYTNPPPRDFSENIQALGKNLFHRRGKSKQELVDSSASSMYSSDTPTDTFLVGPKESLMTSLFSRRKPSREEPTQRRVQISTPFNFQHVTHTDRENVSGPELWEREQLAAHAAGTDVQRRRATSKADQYAPFLASNPLSPQPEQQSSFQLSRPNFISRHTSSFSGVRKFMKTGRSVDLDSAPINTDIPEEVTGPPPPRPPRSPVTERYMTAVSPLRRTESPHPNEFGAQQAPVPASPSSDRPHTSSAYQPLGYSIPLESVPPSPSPSRTPTSVSDAGAPWPNDMFLQPPPIPSEPAWPLASPTITNFQTQMTTVAEEHGLTNPSGPVDTSTRLSLRGSKSVPMLRPSLQIEAPPATSQSHMNLADLAIECDVIRESWEDDIDYCYDHEVEADCDYRWERPSMDVPRDHVVFSHGPVRSMAEMLSASNNTGHATASPSVQSSSSFDVPALSPASHYSATPGYEAATPNVRDSTGNNYSFPRPIARKPSRASLLKTHLDVHDSQGFGFSSSFEDEYHKHLLSVDQGCRGLSQPVASVGGDDDDNDVSARTGQRASTTTTASNYSTDSSSTGERHISTNSAMTALTRHTASSTSLTKLSGPWELKDEAPPVPLKDTAANEEEMSEDTVSELKPLPMLPVGARSMHKVHASISGVPVDFLQGHNGESERPLRPRARTASLSSQGLPVGHFALFPRPMGTDDAARNSHSIATST